MDEEQIGGIAKAPFRLYDDSQKEKDITTMSIRLNKQEQDWLKEIRVFFQEDKDSTAIKLLIKLGLDVIHETKMITLRDTLLKKKVNNQRIGIVEVE